MGGETLRHRSETWEVSFLRTESLSSTCKFAFRWAGSRDWFGEGQCLDWHCNLSGFFPNSIVTLAAARSGLTCSFSPLVVVCGGDGGGSGLLLPLQSLWLPVALQGPLLLFTRWEVRLTSFRELHTEMPLSAALSRKRPWLVCASDRFSTHKQQKKERKKRHISPYFYYGSIIYIFTSFSPFHTVQECRGNHSRLRAGIKPASETADFNLYLNPLGPRVQTQTKLLGLCRERVRLQSFFSYSAPCGDAIYEEKEFL